eukprot:ctg_445.g232
MPPPPPLSPRRTRRRRLSERCVRRRYHRHHVRPPGARARRVSQVARLCFRREAVAAAVSGELAGAGQGRAAVGSAAAATAGARGRRRHRRRIAQQALAARSALAHHLPGHTQRTAVVVSLAKDRPFHLPAGGAPDRRPADGRGEHAVRADRRAPIQPQPPGGVCAARGGRVLLRTGAQGRRRGLPGFIDYLIQRTRAGLALDEDRRIIFIPPCDYSQHTL